VVDPCIGTITRHHVDSDPLYAIHSHRPPCCQLAQDELESSVVRVFTDLASAAIGAK
jgi:hypothetical protein